MEVFHRVRNTETIGRKDMKVRDMLKLRIMPITYMETETICRAVSMAPVKGEDYGI